MINIWGRMDGVDVVHRSFATGFQRDKVFKTDKNLVDKAVKLTENHFCYSS
jgi:hypothetical protein